MDIHFIEDLERALEDELPGRSVQQLMIPYDLSQFDDLIDSSKIACVLVLLYPKGKEWHIALLERPGNNLSDVHAGQIGLPGGRVEESDYSYQDCALRETNEELGIDQSEIGIIGELTSVFAKASNHIVYPFVGFTVNEPEFNPQKSEVERLIEMPLKDLLNPKLKKKKDIEVSSGVSLKNTPYYDFEGNMIWGVTGMILREFEEVLLRADLI